MLELEKIIIKILRLNTTLGLSEAILQLEFFLFYKSHVFCTRNKHVQTR